MEIGIAFIIKKIIAWLLMPMPLGIMMLILALWLLHQGNHRRAKQFLLGTILWFGVVTHAHLSSLLLLPLESRYEKIGHIPAGGEVYFASWRRQGETCLGSDTALQEDRRSEDCHFRVFDA